ncbi:MAG TPA: arsenate reductase ArsC [Pyrinomonadaceae bacterium]|nr:arsenate reductase ArsC [Pyrinomonadaceae bacterium]
MSNKNKVLILCTGNSARSQMAEGLMREMGGTTFEVASAGVSPTQVRSEAVEVMKEIGIDISQHFSKDVDRFVADNFDYVITVCDNANERCPVFPGHAKRIHWSFADPAQVEGDEATKLSAFRTIRDQIKARIETFIDSTSGR